MPTPTLVVEDGTGLLTANSYATVAEADAYHDRHYYAAAWIAASTDNKTKTLIWSTRLIDEQAHWKGELGNYALDGITLDVVSTQALRWPRSYVYTPDHTLIEFGTIPVWLKDATAELARYLLGADRTAERDTAGVKEIEVGPIRLVVDPTTQTPMLPRSVISLIAPYATIKGVKRGWVSLIRI